MTRQQRITLRIAILVVLSGAIAPGSAMAAIWQWGCAGGDGTQQIAFNRGQLIVTAGKPSLGKLDDLVMAEDIAAAVAKGAAKATPVIATYQAADQNGGFEKTMAFADADNRKLTLTELSSKRTSHREKLIAHCRDETTDRFAKTYRLERDGEPPRTIKLQCMEYQLSTRGGRTCR